MSRDFTTSAGIEPRAGIEVVVGEEAVDPAVRRLREQHERREHEQEMESERREKALSEPIDPTPGERRNGWTAEALTAYVGRRKAAQSFVVDPASEARRQARKPQRTKRYRPLRWRG